MIKYGMDASPQTYARAAGVLLLITIIAGGIGEAYVPAKLIELSDPAITARNIQASDFMFRVGFAFYLLEAVSDISLAMIFYLLLRPIREDLALLAVLFRIVSTSTFAFAMFFYFASSIVLERADYLGVFSSQQQDALALLLLRFYGICGGVFMLFHGIASILFGFLMFKSGYFPRILGALLALGGVGFVGRNFILLLAPEHASNFYLLPAVLGGVLMMFWMIIKGVNVAKWADVVARREGSWAQAREKLR